MFFMIRLINTYISFPNSKDTVKQSHCTFGWICSDFLSDIFLIFLINIKYQREK